MALISQVFWNNSKLNPHYISFKESGDGKIKEIERGENIPSNPNIVGAKLKG